jgi:RNA polymerase sigma-70 factor (ECF subfamily)
MAGEMYVTPAAAGPDGWFPATRWSLVLAAQDGGEAAAKAMESLCRLYWKPVYTFIRAHGSPPEDAEDLAQEYFARLLHRDLLQGTAPGKGKLRTFLAVTLRNFLSNARVRRSAKKRGGGLQRVEADVAASEALLLASPDAGPDKLFDRHWALTLLGRVMDRLGAEYRQAGRGDVFVALKGSLTLEGPAADSRTIAAQLGLSDGAVRVAAYRMRQRYRDLLVEETAQTLGDDVAVEDELRALLEIV